MNAQVDEAKNNSPTEHRVSARLSGYNGRVSFRIRKVASGDFEKLWRIDQICFDPQLAYSRPELAFYMRRPSAFTLVAESNADERSAADGNPPLTPPAILGFIVAEKAQRSGHIITIDVIPKARRLGVGSLLLAAAEDRLLESGALAVELETAVNNEPAIRFYKQKGYFVERTVRGYYSNHLDALLMAKPLPVKMNSSHGT